MSWPYSEMSDGEARQDEDEATLEAQFRAAKQAHEDEAEQALRDEDRFADLAVGLGRISSESREHDQVAQGSRDARSWAIRHAARKGMPQADIARACQLTRSRVNQIIAGRPYRY